MNWIELKEEEQLNSIKELSKEHPILIYKHSTRCSISSTALDRLQRSWKDTEMPNVKTYFLDLLKFKPLSNTIATEFDVHHESPQLLIIINGKCIYHRSHLGISYTELSQQLKSKS